MALSISSASLRRPIVAPAPLPPPISTMTPAESRALDKLAAEHPSRIKKLGKNVEVAVIGKTVLVGQWKVRDGERHLYWGKVNPRSELPPTTADFKKLDELATKNPGKIVRASPSIDVAVVNGKLMIGRWQKAAGERHLFWNQGATL